MLATASGHPGPSLLPSMIAGAASMCQSDSQQLTFETLLSDPLVRLVMQSDGVSTADLVAVLEIAREAVVAREAVAVHRAMRVAVERPDLGGIAVPWRPAPEIRL